MMGLWVSGQGTRHFNRPRVSIHKQCPSRFLEALRVQPDYHRPGFQVNWIFEIWETLYKKRENNREMAAGLAAVGQTNEL